jgi:hypothetical protein
MRDKAAASAANSTRIACSPDQCWHVRIVGRMAKQNLYVGMSPELQSAQDFEHVVLRSLHGDNHR